MNDKLPASQSALLDWYAALTPESLRALCLLYRTDAHFKDPFNDVRGHAAISRVFSHMFAVTVAPRFLLGENLSQDRRLFVTWDFDFGLGQRRYLVHGSSLIKFDEDGLVASHRDYWDPTEELWQHLPVLGRPVAWLRRRFEAR